MRKNTSKILNDIIKYAKLGLLGKLVTPVTQAVEAGGL